MCLMLLLTTVLSITHQYPVFADHIVELYGSFWEYTFCVSHIEHYTVIIICNYIVSVLSCEEDDILYQKKQQL